MGFAGFLAEFAMHGSKQCHCGRLAPKDKSDRRWKGAFGLENRLTL
jgi:hypothetical protein